MNLSLREGGGEVEGGWGGGGRVGRWREGGGLQYGHQAAQGDINSWPSLPVLSNTKIVMRQWRAFAKTMSVGRHLFTCVTTAEPPDSKLIS